MATEVNTLFSSLCYLTPLWGAYWADRHWGRFHTILRFGMVYNIGLYLCCLGALPTFWTSPVLFLSGLFGGVAMGSGG